MLPRPTALPALAALTVAIAMVATGCGAAPPGAAVPERASDAPTLTATATATERPTTPSAVPPRADAAGTAATGPAQRAAPTPAPSERPTAAAQTATPPATSAPAATTATPAPTPTPAHSPAASGAVTWQHDGTSWRALGGTPPACPSPLELPAPVDPALVYSVLYPGQFRGNDYKPHGGFRFDGQPNDVPSVRVPLAGVAMRGGRYLERGEVQHLIDIIAPCGIMIRFDHLLVLTAPLAAAFASFPAPVEGDSRTSSFAQPVALSAGVVIATAVGVRQGPNVFVDFGVYDLRSRNAAATDPTWAAAHGGELAPYAICWLDVLAPAAASTLRALPAGDSVSGATSDLCGQ